MPGFFSRLKNWNAKEVLSYSDLNSEFNNIITNCDSSHLGGFSTSVPQMQSQVSPGAVGSESRPDTISGELERLRYVISRIVGKTYWYEAPIRSLQTAVADVSNYLVSGIKSATSVFNWNDAISNLVGSGLIEGSNFTSATAVASGSSFKKMADTPFSLQNDPAFPCFFYQIQNGSQGQENTISLWFRNFAPLNVIYYDFASGLIVRLNGSGFLELTQYYKQSTVNGSKTSQTITGSTNLALNTSFQNIIIRRDYASPTGTLKVEMLHNGTLIGSISSTSNIVNFPASNARSVIMGSRSTVTFADYLTNPATDLPTAYGWGLTGTAGSVSSGILTLSPGAAAQSYYSKAVFSAIAANGNIIEMKYRLRNVSTSVSGPTNGAPFEVYLRIDASNVGLRLQINGNSIQVGGSTGGIASYVSNVFAVDHNSTDWTTLTLKVTLATSYLYINGILVGSFATPVADTTAGDTLAFGKLVAAANSYADIDIESMYFGTAFTGTDFYTANAGPTQQVSDFCHIKGYLEDATLITSLQNNSPFSIFGNRPNIRSYCNNSSAYSGITIAANTTSSLGTVGQFISDGKSPSKFMFQVVVGQSAATAGTYSFGAYVEISGVSTGATSETGQSFFANPASGALSLYESMTQVIPATNVPNLMFPVRIDFAQVLPAGVYNVVAKVNAATGNPANIQVRSYKFISSM